MGITKQTPISIDQSHNPQATLPLDSHMLKMVMNQASMNLAKALNEAKKASYDFRDVNEQHPPSRADTLAKAVMQSRTVMQKVFSQQISSRQSLGEKRLELISNMRSPDTSMHSRLSEFELEESILPSPNDVDHDTLESHSLKPEQETDIHGTLTVGKYTTESANTGLHVHKNLLSAVPGQPQLVVDAFKKSAAESAAEPFQYLGKSLVQNGADHFASTVATNSLILPLGILTLRAGIKEVQHTNHELKHLNTQREQQSTELQSLEHAKKIMTNNALEPSIQAQSIRLDKTKEAIEETRTTRRIGMTAIASGLTISLKSLSNIGLNFALGIKSALMGKGFFALSEAAKYTPAASAAAGLGLAGALVFGPVGGLVAAALGTLFTIKTVKKLNQLKTDFELLKGEIKSITLIRQDKVNPSYGKLHDFLIRQGDKRIGFFNQFSRWNKSFLVSSGLYASSAVTKATVAGLAIAGITAAASNPVGLAVITATAIIATIGMGIASMGFFRGYGKQVKYSASTAADHEWVDRKLMTDLHGMKSSVNSPYGAHNGFDMAEACLKFLDSQKSGLRNFMSEVATATGKRSPMEKNLTWWQHLGGKVLNQKDIAKFLNSQQGHEQLRILVTESLLSRSEMLTEKIKKRSLIIENLNSNAALGRPQQTEAVSGEVLNQIGELSSVFERLDQDYAKDQAELEQTLLNMKVIESNPELDQSVLASLINAGTSDEAMSKFLRKEMDFQIRSARGVLFESQLEGARLREKQFKDMTRGSRVEI